MLCGREKSIFIGPQGVFLKFFFNIFEVKRSHTEPPHPRVVRILHSRVVFYALLFFLFVYFLLYVFFSFKYKYEARFRETATQCTRFIFILKLKLMNLGEACSLFSLRTRIDAGMCNRTMVIIGSLS